VICSLDDEVGVSSTYMEDVPLVLILCSFFFSGSIILHVACRLSYFNRSFSSGVKTSMDNHGGVNLLSLSASPINCFGFMHLVFGCM
jgi:hypothetical protein